MDGKKESSHRTAPSKREYRYKEQQELLRRSLRDMLTSMQVIVWLMAVITVISIGIFVRLVLL